MKRTNPQAPPPFRLGANYLATAGLSWLIPGVGHWLLGHRVRAVLIGVSLLGSFWLGEWTLGEKKAVTWDVHPIFFCLQAGNGFSAFMADSLWGTPRNENGIVANAGQTDAIDLNLPDYLSLGILLCSVSGLLNLLVVIHVLDPRTWQEAEVRQRGEPAS